MKIDTITIKGKKSACFNLHESVGPGGMNKRGDVMLIQAFLRYIGTFDHLAQDGDAVPEVPDLTGTFDHKTADVIRTYQQAVSFRLISSDGRIDPASYRNRNIKDVFKPLMTITYLHIHAKNAGRFYGTPNYINGMIRSMPQLLPYIALDAKSGGLLSLGSLSSSLKGLFPG